MINNTGIIVIIAKLEREISVFYDELKKLLPKKDCHKLVGEIVSDLVTLGEILDIKEDDAHSMLVWLISALNLLKLNGREELSNFSGVQVASNWNILSSKKIVALKYEIDGLSGKKDFFITLVQNKDKNTHLYKRIHDFLFFITENVLSSKGIGMEQAEQARRKFAEFAVRTKEDVSKRRVKRISELFQEHNDLIRDTDGHILLHDIDTLKKIISENQKFLLEFDQDSIKEFLLVIKVLELIKRGIKESEVKLHNSISVSLIDVWFELLYSQIRSFKYLYTLLVKQIKYGIKTDILNYFDIRQFMESKGFYITTADKQKIELLDQLYRGQASIFSQLISISDQLSSIDKSFSELNSNLINLTDSVMSLESTLSEGFKQVTQGIHDLTVSLDNGFIDVNDRLQSIDSAIGYNNLVTTINTYTNYRMNRKISELLK